MSSSYRPAFQTATVKAAPEGAALDEAYRQLQERVRETTGRAQGVPDAEVEQVIEEALSDLEQHGLS